MKSLATFAVSLLGVVLLAGSLLAQDTTIPPMITQFSPVGVRRGTTVRVTLEGRNLGEIRRVLFDKAGLTGKYVDVSSVPEDPIDPKSTAAVVPLGLRQKATIEITASAGAEIGIHSFRVETALGTSNLKMLDVGGLPEVHAVEGSMEQAERVSLTATLVGDLGRPGDTDRYSFEARAGEELVFQPVAAAIGSDLRAVLTLTDAQGNEMARAGDAARRPDSALIFKVPADGKYSLEVADLAHAGGRNYFYRIHSGALPYVTSVYPLGVRAGSASEVTVTGAGMGNVHSVRVEAPAGVEGGRTLPVRINTPMGTSLNEIRLAVGPEPDMEEVEGNDTPENAQPLVLPVAVNGKIRSERAGKSDADYFRFHLRMGERIIAEVAADRLGSRLDSVVEALDEQGREIRTATARAVHETPSTLSDRDSKNPNYRLTALSGFFEGDYIMVDDELNRIVFLPDQPDENIVVRSFGNERYGELNTSPQAHPVNVPIYKVQIFEPGRQFPPNGLPVFHLTARNDDGGPGFGADSRLDFTAPRDSEFRLRIKDVNGLQGENFAYRLTIRREEKDFMLTANPANPNVPRGGRVPVEVAANRARGYLGPIEIELKGLPPGLTATRSMIPAGQDSTVVVIEAADDLKLEELAPAPIEIEGRGFAEGARLVRVADAEKPLRVVSVMPPPDIVVTAEPREVTIEAGGTAEFTFSVERKNKFHGRVPCNALALPPGVSIDNTGLNGVMIVEGKTSRKVKLAAADWAPAGEQPFYVVAQVESNSTTTHAAAPFRVRVLPKTMTASAGTN